MAESGFLPSPTNNYRRPNSPFFSSPKLSTGFSSKAFSESETEMSPTSILDSKPFSGLRSPFWYETTKNPKTPPPDVRRPWDKLDSKRIGLGIVDALTDENSEPKPTKPETRMVLFGSQLKIQIPHLSPSLLLSPAESPKSPADIGIKNRNCQVSSLSLSPARKFGIGSTNSGPETPNSPRVFIGCLSASEMEMSEDYTCVISHGPNPKTTHIFDDCIVESCSGVFSASRNDNGNELVVDDQSSHSSQSFLSFCYTCKKDLGQDDDIYMYRGEQAFCSHECRHQEMLLEEEIKKMEADIKRGQVQSDLAQI